MNFPWFETSWVGWFLTWMDEEGPPYEVEDLKERKK